MIHERTRDFSPNLFGIKIFSLESHSAGETIAELAREYPHVPIIAGGPHVSIVPPADLFQQFPALTYGIRGEAEISLPLLTNAMMGGTGPDLSMIPGLVYRTDNGVRSNPLVLHKNLDDFGFPAWDLIDPRNYDDRWFFWARDYPGAPILATRGCPYHCTFCAQNVVTGKEVRRRSPEHIIEELNHLYESYGIRNFDFIDDHLLLGPKFIHKIVWGIINNGKKISWSAGGARLDFLDRELIQLLDRSGCEIIGVGIESGTKRVLDYMRKGLSTDLVKEKMFLINRLSNIKVIGLFILGFPTETAAEVRKTIDFACQLPLHMANFNTYISMPGCEEFDRLIARGEIDAPNWEELGLDAHTYVPKGMTRRQLQSLYRQAILRFYARPSRLLNILWYSRNRIPHLFHKAIRKTFWKS